MLPHGASVMKLQSIKQVTQTVLYSRAHIDRLEKAGCFPKRVRLGQGRIGYVEEEIQAWLRAKVAERDADTGS